MVRIAILDLTTQPEDLLSGLPRVYEQITNWLSPAFPEAEIIPYDIATNGAELPDLQSFDGLLLSGSEVGVYDDTPWMQPLCQLLLEAKNAGKPIYGICFGHQVMADVFGGKAEYTGNDAVIGAHSFADGSGNQFDAYVWHKDQVTKVPPGATVTASAEYCPVGMLEYDFPAASVQFHPEYRESHLLALYDRLPDEIVSAEQEEAAKRSFENAHVKADLQAHEAADFFRRHLG